MLTLTEFLLARIAEDESTARNIDAEYRAEVARDRNPTPVEPDFGLHESETRGYPALMIGAARVLAECEAKRRIVELHPVGDDGHCCSDPDDPRYGEKMYFGEPCPTLRALALPYADHPDCREEWAP